MNHNHLNSFGSLPSFDNGHSHHSLGSLGKTTGLSGDHYLGNGPLARALSGTAMPEDSSFAKAELSAGMGKLSPLSQSAVLSVLNGSCNAEDHSLAAGALKHICRGTAMPEASSPIHWLGGRGPSSGPIHWLNK